MDLSVINRLLEINNQFYQTFAGQFSATRQRIQPGVRAVIKDISRNQSILDIGCGNGNLFSALMQIGYRGNYTGIDSSAALLALAETNASDALRASGVKQKPAFLLADLTQENWEEQISGVPFDIITAFAVLHHIPGYEYRLRALKSIRGMLKPGGWMAISVWQFLNSSRLRSRIVDWSQVNLDSRLLEPGDYLLDWRSGGLGFRYTHQFDLKELDILAHLSDFKIQKSFYSDGSEGNLGLYQIWSAFT